MEYECFSCHADGVDGVPATKFLTFYDSNQKMKGNVKIWVCDPCYEVRMKNDKQDNLPTTAPSTDE